MFERRRLDGGTSLPSCFILVSPDQADAITILTELTTSRGNLLVILRVGQNDANIEVNKITSIYGKNKSGVLNWLQGYSGEFRYLNKKESSSFLETYTRAPIAQGNQE